MYQAKKENVIVACRVILIVVTRLVELCALPHDYMDSILTFFKKASHPKFVRYIEKLIDTKLDADLENPFFGRGVSNQDIVLEQVQANKKKLHTLKKLLDCLKRLYLKLCNEPGSPWIKEQKNSSKAAFTAGTGALAGYKCFNCGKPLNRHNPSAGECKGVSFCKSTIDQARVDKAKKAAGFDKGGRGGRGGRGRGRGGRFGRGGGGGGNPTRGKPPTPWSAPNKSGTTPGFNPKSSGPPKHNKIYQYKNRPKAYCSVCSWNDDHTTAFHKIYIAQGANFNMCTIAPHDIFSMALAAAAPTEEETPPQEDTQASSSAATISKVKDKLETTFAAFSATVADDADEARLEQIRESIFSALN
jgi:hypothetical protein